MSYREFLNGLYSVRDEKYRDFQKKLLKNDSINVIGVKVPTLRKIAAKYDGRFDELLAYPDEFYEVTFIKLCAASRLPYGKFTDVVDKLVPLIDNWATCDCFTPACIADNKADFLPFIRKYAASDKEFHIRFALTTLLHFYVESEYLETVFSLVERCDTSCYYASTAAAWLIAETLVKYYDAGKSFLLDHSLDKRTHNLAIRKACESFRLSNDRKNYLKGIKR